MKKTLPGIFSYSMKRAMLCFMCIFHFSLCNSQSWAWVKPSVNTNISTEGDASSLALGDGGSVYQVGTYIGSVMFGSHLLSAPSTDAFLVKYDSNGNVIWAANAVSTYPNGCSAVASDKSGNAIITGSFSDTILFGVHKLTTISFYNDYYVAKYSPVGNALWAQQAKVSSTGGPQGSAVATDKWGNIYTTGFFKDTVTFGTITLITPDISLFLVKYDSNGNVKWARCPNVPISCQGNALVTDSKGNVIISGDFYNSVTFGTYTLNTSKPNDHDEFIAKYDSSGNVLWAEGGKETAYIGGSGLGLAEDENDNTYSTGQFFDTLTFGTHKVICNNNEGDVYLVKYDSSGNVVWAKGGIVPNTASASASNLGYSITTSKGHVYLSGSFSDSISFDAVHIYANDFEPAYIVELDSLGNGLCGTFVNNYNDDIGSVLANPSGSFVYFGGDVEGGYKAAFGSDTVYTTGGELSFFAKWQPCTTVTGIDNLYSNNIGVVVYPNPSSNGIFIVEQRAEKQREVIEVYDMIGEKVFASSVSPVNSQFTINLGNKAKGIYLYRVIKDNIQVLSQGKLIIQ